MLVVCTIRSVSSSKVISYGIRITFSQNHKILFLYWEQMRGHFVGSGLTQNGRFH